MSHSGRSGLPGRRPPWPCRLGAAPGSNGLLRRPDRPTSTTARSTCRPPRRRLALECRLRRVGVGQDPLAEASSDAATSTRTPCSCSCGSWPPASSADTAAHRPSLHSSPAIRFGLDVTGHESEHGDVVRDFHSFAAVARCGHGRRVRRLAAGALMAGRRPSPRSPRMTGAPASAHRFPPSAGAASSSAGEPADRQAPDAVPCPVRRSAPLLPGATVPPCAGLRALARGGRGANGGCQDSGGRDPLDACGRSAPAEGCRPARRLHGRTRLTAIADMTTDRTDGRGDGEPSR
jgi:hypothetical protein